MWLNEQKEKYTFKSVNCTPLLNPFYRMVDHTMHFIFLVSVHVGFRIALTINTDKCHDPTIDTGYLSIHDGPSANLNLLYENHLQNITSQHVIKATTHQVQVTVIVQDMKPSKRAFSFTTQSVTSGVKSYILASNSSSLELNPTKECLRTHDSLTVFCALTITNTLDKKRFSNITINSFNGVFSDTENCRYNGLLIREISSDNSPANNSGILCTVEHLAVLKQHISERTFQIVWYFYNLYSNMLEWPSFMFTVMPSKCAPIFLPQICSPEMERQAILLRHQHPNCVVWQYNAIYFDNSRLANCICNFIIVPSQPHLYYHWLSVVTSVGLPEAGICRLYTVYHDLAVDGWRIKQVSGLTKENAKTWSGYTYTHNHYRVLIENPNCFIQIIIKVVKTYELRHLAFKPLAYILKNPGLYWNSDNFGDTYHPYHITAINATFYTAVFHFHSANFDHLMRFFAITIVPHPSCTPECAKDNIILLEGSPYRLRILHKDLKGMYEHITVSDFLKRKLLVVLVNRQVTNTTKCQHCSLEISFNHSHIDTGYNLISSPFWGSRCVHDKQTSAIIGCTKDKFLPYIFLHLQQQLKHVIFKSPTNVTWEESRQKCAKLNGSLLKFYDKYESEVFFWNIKSQYEELKMHDSNQIFLFYTAIQLSPKVNAY